MNHPVASVLVCTHNRGAILGTCLDHLLRQTLPRTAFEIVVVDNASTDGTAELCRAYADRGVRYLHDPVTGLSHARNTGWRAVATDLVAYLDDDALADAGWLEAAVQAYRTLRPAPGAMGGPVRLIWPQPEPSWMNAVLRMPLGEVDWGAATRPLRPGEWIVGANCFYDRGLLERLGGFDESLGRKGLCLLSGEETLLHAKVERAGGTLLYVAGAGVGHVVAPERMRPRWFYRRYFWAGVSDVLMRRRLPPGGTAAASGSVSGNALRNRWLRLAYNGVASLDPFSVVRRIPARVYWCYVAGFLMARLRQGRTGEGDA